MYRVNILPELCPCLCALLYYRNKLSTVNIKMNNFYPFSGIFSIRVQIAQFTDESRNYAAWRVEVRVLNPFYPV